LAQINASYLGLLVYIPIVLERCPYGRRC